MKREQRVGYLGLTAIGLPSGGNAIMCSFCRYSKWSGGCKEAYAECHHSLWRVREDESEKINCGTGMGSDCWGFRPSMPIGVAADVVGLWLQGMEPDWDTVPRLEVKQKEGVE